MGWVHEIPEGVTYDAKLLATQPVAGITTLLQALADPVRLEVVRQLAESTEPRPCGSLITTVTKSTMSHHLRLLREAGIIETRLEGTRKLTSLRRAELEAAYPGLIDSVLRAPAELPHSAAEPAAAAAPATAGATQR